MPTIAEIATQINADNGEFTLLLRALETTGLTGAVAAADADLTVFAPTDAAFTNLAASLGVDVSSGDKHVIFDGLVSAVSGLGDPVAILSDVLLYHVSPGGQSLHDLRDAGTISTANSTGATFEVNGDELIDKDPDAANPEFVEGLTDVGADNGVIHVIDNVLLPLDVPQVSETPSIAEIATQINAESGEFTLLLKALEATNLTSAVADESADLTVFAPTDAAFTNLAKSLGVDVSSGDKNAIFDGLVSAVSGLGDPVAILSDVLLYHVSPGGQSLHDLRDAGTISTANSTGATIEVNGDELIDKDPEADNPEFVEGLTDVGASNGVVHVIDNVLLPVDVPQAPAADSIAALVLAVSGDSGFDGNGGDFDILREALTAADLVGAVADADADLTVFAPTDDAFISLARSAGADIADGDDQAAFEAIVGLLEGLTGSSEAAIATLGDILKYHVSAGSNAVEELQGEVATLLGSSLTVDGSHITDADPSLGNAGIIDDLSNLVTGNGIVQAIDQVLLPIDLAEARDAGSSEVLRGDRGDNRIFGDGGDDLIKGLAGDDELSGGTGDDRIFGNNGEDNILGGAGDDRIFGNNGNDLLSGGAGDDRIGGNGGHDEVVYDGNAENFTIERATTNLFRMTDNNGDEGTDLIGGIELFTFADGSFGIEALSALEIGDVVGVDDVIAGLAADSADAGAAASSEPMMANLDMSAMIAEDANVADVM